MSMAKDIVYFDTSCGFCWKSIEFIYTNDSHSKPRFFFAPNEKLQARDQLVRPDENVVVLTQQGKFLEGVSAIIYILCHLQSKRIRLLGYCLFYSSFIFGWIYRLIYRLIAKRRKKSCPLLSKVEMKTLQSRFYTDD